MAANTTIKVASLTGAAKDDFFSVAQSGLTEDALVSKFNVLSNDPGAARLYSLVQDTSGFTSTSQFPVATTALSAKGAQISINADGTIAYDASGLGAGFQSLAEGEMATDTFSYTVRMANGALSTAKVTVQIGGMNDRPTLAAIDTVAILDTAEDDTPTPVTGTLAGADVDHGAVLTYGFGAGATGSMAGGMWVAQGDYGTLTLDPATGNYSFVADPDKIDALKSGETASASFDVVVTDEHGAVSDTVTLSFHLVGANDTAEISGDNGGTVQEDTTLTTGGTLSVADRDAGESSFAAVADGQLHGTYGDFTFDSDTGAWTYTLNNDGAHVQALNSGETVYDQLVVSSMDGSDSETIQVAVSGLDEPHPPVPSGGNPPPPEVPPPQAAAVTHFMVNFGQTDVNGKQTLLGFDSDDLLTYSPNYDFMGIISVDTDGDGTMDSSSAHFEFTHGKNMDAVDVVLVGYMDLTDAQVVPA